MTTVEKYTLDRLSDAIASGYEPTAEEAARFDFLIKKYSDERDAEADADRRDFQTDAGPAL